MHRAIKRAVKQQIPVVSITGNQDSSVQYPGKYKEVIAVTSIDKHNQLAGYSNHGPQVAFAAPGEEVSSLMPDGGYSAGRGTSFPAPHISGTAALLLSINPGLEINELYRVLKETAVDLGPPGRDDQFGYGLINTKFALESVFKTGVS